ncbi:hypothetical protein F2Q68_00040109 [Brassica cretica]|uniref:VAN3-binding protein-like auxin canalisation domain-containing protein n=1 Tax=Brassica cretica TaxID=69181 RepID=A0A8S9MMD8_BRACR|nr:hypothetical protein F2Q68_00040109 [Brassica cretica]
MGGEVAVDREIRKSPSGETFNRRREERQRERGETASTSPLPTHGLTALEVSKALTPSDPQILLSKTEEEPILGDGDTEESGLVSGNPFSFASSETSQMVMDRILSQSQEVSPRTSGRLSHSSSGPLNGSLTDSPPPESDEIKFLLPH